jgi:hypothetical protein
VQSWPHHGQSEQSSHDNALQTAPQYAQTTITAQTAIARAASTRMIHIPNPIIKPIMNAQPSRNSNTNITMTLDIAVLIAFTGLRNAHFLSVG